MFSINSLLLEGLIIKKKHVICLEVQNLRGNPITTGESRSTCSSAATSTEPDWTTSCQLTPPIRITMLWKSGQPSYHTGCVTDSSECLTTQIHTQLKDWAQNVTWWTIVLKYMCLSKRLKNYKTSLLFHSKSKRKKTLHFNYPQL